MGDNDHSETSLIARAREGDVEAFSGLVEMHQDRVINVIYRSLKDREIAEDLAQEVFLQAWKTIEKFDERAKLSTWLYRVAMNAVVSHVRYTKAQKRGGDASELSFHANEEMPIDPAQDHRRDGPSDSPDAALQATELRQEIIEAIHGLEEESRQVIILRDLEGLSYEAIAEVLDINLGTVRSRLHRGRERLREKLRHLMEADAEEGASHA